MSNKAAYAGGLLNRALDPTLQPLEIRTFLDSEMHLLREITTEGMRVIDLGCGTGRHLAILHDRVALGVGVDYQHAYLVEALTRSGSRPLHFVAADATRVPIDHPFDLAVCMTNTWGTMMDKAGVLREMRRLAPGAGRRLLSVYAPDSVPARCEWYRRLGEGIREVTDEYVLTESGFRSEHFSEARLGDLIGDCSLRPLAGIAYAVTF